MDYQADYFKNNPNSKFELLADNVKHPFNEFIKVAVEFGLMGLAIVLSIVVFVLWKLIKSKDENRGLVLSGLASFLILSCFSYPLHYVAVWLFLAFYVSLLLPPQVICIKNASISIMVRCIIAVVCAFLMVHIIGQIRAEIKWKTIAMSSLKGNTEEMLPEYEKLYSTSLKLNPFFLYIYGAELNVAGKFDKSVEVLNECKRRFNDFDLQMLLAGNYSKMGEQNRAILTYQYASNMIPCRFLPKYQIFNIYKDSGQKHESVKYANEIIAKKVKIPSSSIQWMQVEAEEYLNEFESTMINVY